MKEESAKGDTQFTCGILDLNLTSMPKIIPSPNKKPWLVNNPSVFNTVSVLSEETCQKHTCGCTDPTAQNA